ncbi:MAG: class I SAM-dependent methyltransferase [Micromonosporaceae bacterium]|nr:class I SAM-dependent methyltransferase [Micromonosporaceae bacterium]
MHPTNPGLSFGPAAQLYDTIRPSYPPDAVAWALAPLGPGRWRIADIGAGTGIMTRLLAAAGHDVIAVEPDALMRAQLAATTTATSVTAVDGSAEALPVDHAALDGAVAAQAYHWFDRSRAHAELARVIRPGGVFAAVWNRRDDSVPWVAEYSRIVDGAKTDAAGRDRFAYTVETYGPQFGAVEQARFRHRTRHTPESLVRLMQSRSYYLRASATRQRDLVRAVVDLTRRHPDLAGRAEFDLPYETLVFRAVRVGGGED